MKRLANNLAQLDLALELLSAYDANNARFALMLTDNIVEINLHYIAISYAAKCRRAGGGQLKFARETHDALGRHFESKVKLAKLLDTLSQDVADSINIAHNYRNEVYHVGIQYEEILPALSKFYFGVACAALRDLPVNGIGWGSNQELPERAKKFFPDYEKRFFSHAHEHYKKACELLGDHVANSGDELKATLLTHMEKIINEKDHFIDYLVGGHPRGERITRDQAVIDCQAWPVAFSEKGKDFLRRKPPTDWSVFGCVQWIGKEYPLNQRIDPIPSWRNRLSSLRSEKNSHKALAKYQNFMHQTATLRGWIDDATSALDAYVEEQIERMRLD